MEKKNKPSPPHWTEDLGPLTRVSSSKIAPMPSPKTIKVRAADNHVSSSTHLPLVNKFVAGGDYLEYLPEGLSRQKVRALKKGRISPSYHLDLHDISPSHLVDELNRSISHCQDMGIKQLTVVHGKNISSDVAKTKSILNEILRQHNGIGAFVSAPPAMGGTGALLCLIKQKKESKP